MKNNTGSIIYAFWLFVGLFCICSLASAESVLPWCLDVPRKGAKVALQREKQYVVSRLARELQELELFATTPAKQAAFRSVKSHVNGTEKSLSQVIATLPRDFSLCLFPVPSLRCTDVPLQLHKVLGPRIRALPAVLEKALFVARPAVGSSASKGAHAQRRQRLQRRIRSLQMQTRLIPPAVSLCS